MEHAIKIAAAIVDRLPKQTCSPETTEGSQGFLHPIAISGALEQTTLKFIVRDFTDQGLQEKEALLESIVKDVMTDFPRSTCRQAARTVRGCRSWDCPAPTFSPASTRSIRDWNGSACRTWRKPPRPSFIWR